MNSIWNEEKIETNKKRRDETITAKQAIEQADKYNHSFEETLNKIFREINWASKTGARSVLLNERNFPDAVWHHVTSTQTIERLQKLGFEVRPVSSERYIMITWYNIREE